MNFQSTKMLPRYNRFANPAEKSESNFRTILFLLIHAALAIAIYQNTQLATIYALGTVAVGLALALFSKKTENATYAAAYIVGAEVLWRMTSAGILWETAKYATSAILFIILLRSKQWKITSLATLYFLVLLPSVVYTISSSSIGEARDALSFNLSGPFTLMICAWFFSQISITRPQLQRIFIAVIAPIVGVFAIAVYSTLTSASIDFSDEANFITSGGFGPNQVSAILSLAALFIYFILSNSKVNSAFRVLLFILFIAFIVQSALTFSRTGLYLIGVGILASSLPLVRDQKALFRNLVFFLILYLITTYFVLPWLDSFTNGFFIQRIQNTSLTGRDLLMKSDLEIWRDNFWLGVGPGMSTNLHVNLFRVAASHTEFTRLLAEHGLLGLISIILLAIIAFRSFIQASGPANKAIIAALIAWFVLYLFSSAMRLAAPSFLFGLAMSRLFTEADAPATTEPPTQPARRKYYGRYR